MAASLRMMTESTIAVMDLGFLDISTDHQSHMDKNSERERPAIVTLISPSKKDISQAKMMLASVDQFLNDSYTTPLLFFNEGDLTMDQQHKLSNFTRRKVLFPLVDFQQFPAGFNQTSETPPFEKRSKWGYAQMCRFWITRIWKHEIISNYTTLLRMDVDSCLKNVNGGPFPVLSTLNQSLVYKANQKRQDSPRYTTGIWELVESYLNEHNITPQHPGLWNFVKESHGKAFFYNNFEITRVSFFQRPEVMQFQERVSEFEPFGVFRTRWGDAVIRLTTLAIFASPEQVDESDMKAFYGHRYYGKRAECTPTM